MSDATNAADYPRVVSLTYRVLSKPTHKFQDGAELSGEVGSFKFIVRDSSAVFVPASRFASATEAREALEGLLRAWELHVEMKYGPGMFNFKFLSASVEETPPIPGVLQVASAVHEHVIGEPTLIQTHANYPEPPADFALNDCVDDLAEQYLRAKQSPHSLLKNAYAMLTRLEFEHRSRSEAAAVLGFSEEVFKTPKVVAHSRQRCRAQEVHG